MLQLTKRNDMESQQIELLKQPRTMVMYHCAPIHYNHKQQKPIRGNPTHTLLFKKKDNLLLLTWSKPIHRNNIMGGECAMADSFNRKTGREIAEGRMKGLEETVFLNIPNAIDCLPPTKVKHYIHKAIVEDLEYYIEDAIRSLRYEERPVVVMLADSRAHTKYISFTPPQEVEPSMSGVFG